MTQATIGTKGIISARVFRASKTKPFFVPGFVWAYAKRKRLFFAGRWEDLGVIGTMHDSSVVS